MGADVHCADDSSAQTGMVASVLASGRATNGIAAALSGDVDVQLHHITLAPGAVTAWHYHHGDVLGIITAGTLTRVLADGSVEICPAGTSVVEPGGARNVHYGRNDGTEPVEFYAVYLAPAGAPLSVDVEAPEAAAIPAERTPA